MRRLVTTLVALVSAYGSIAFLVWAAQDRLIYFPTRELSTTPGVYGFGHEDVWLTTADGVRVHGWFIAAPASRATLLYLHGNGGNISHRLQRIALFRRLGLSVLIVDYRGYGRSDGTPDEEGMYRDARAAWEYLVQTRRLAVTELIIYGESLGGAVAAQLARERRPRALILESSFTSLADVGGEAFPWLPVRWLLRHDYPTHENLGQVVAPVLIVHSRDDEIVPFAHGQRLFEAAREPKFFLETHGGHNDGFLATGTAYSDGINAFLREVFSNR
jgi:fermentation-respiration switch protein FrsA (DUF1100 family)